MLITDIPKKGVKETFKNLLLALEDGGTSLARIIPILVSVSILVNMVGITGIAQRSAG